MKCLNPARGQDSNAHVESADSKDARIDRDGSETTFVGSVSGCFPGGTAGNGPLAQEMLLQFSLH
jgi:hypothetical protein